MSGGVDSSVAAALLLREGYEVVGAFMKNWSEHGGEVCAWRQEREDAQAVADQLGIPLLTFDFEEDYRREVYAYMLAEYEAGRTPNPDVLCNEKVKFGPFLQRALAEGADVVATGHYARVEKKPFLPSCPPALLPVACRLMAGVDNNKDQSYFLHRLSQEQLQHVSFPVGELKKSEVRAIARDLQLPVAEKKDSVGICFIGEKNMPEFLAQSIAGRPGPIVSTEGHVVGRHCGIAPFTIGQRHGLGLSDGQPYFVIGKDMPRNTLVVARGEDPAELYSQELIAEKIHWIGEEPELPLQCKARVRYRQPLQECEVKGLPAGQAGARSEGGKEDLLVTFDRPQRAVAPGQFVVFYDGEVCLGGGVIR